MVDMAAGPVIALRQRQAKNEKNNLTSIAGYSVRGVSSMVAIYGSKPQGSGNEELGWMDRRDRGSLAGKREITDRESSNDSSRRSAHVDAVYVVDGAGGQLG